MAPPPSPRDLTPGDYDAPVFSLGGQDNYAFSPDGQEICYTSNHDKVEATSTNNDLWIVPVNNGATGAPPVPPKNITADNPASDSTPLYSPDGKYIAYRAQQRPGYESDRFRLMLYDRKTGEKKEVTSPSRFDVWVGTFVWSPDSSKISSWLKGRGNLDLVHQFLGTRSEWKRSSPGKRNIQLITRGFNDDLAVAGDGLTSSSRECLYSARARYTRSSCMIWRVRLSQIRYN